ncbi:MAG: chloride channel protein [Candidatus Acidoferrales bacterium]
MPERAEKIWQGWLPRLLARLRLTETQVFLALTLIIGLVAGFSAVLFHLAIETLRLDLFGLDEPSGWRTVVVLILVSLFTGYLLLHYFPDSRGSGVPQTSAAFHLAGGVMRARTAVGKFVTGVLTIAAGHSLGREGPSVQIGAGLASVMGRWFRLSPTNVRNLVPVGAAAALSAAFNTPIAAVLFALEEIVGDMNAAVMGSTVLASVAAVVVRRSVLGNEPLFEVPQYVLEHPAELLAYAALGIVGGFVSVAFCKGLLRGRAFFVRLPSWTVVFQPALGGLVVGLVLVAVPQVMGVGYDSVSDALNGNLQLKGFTGRLFNGEALLMGFLVLAAVKIIATIISYASGNAGGIFAPALFIGAMVGGATGTIMADLSPFPTGDAGAYALVGMGALFAGIIRAPMTSVFMIFELTQDYQIIVPLMIANLISYMISRRYQPTPVYHALLRQDGIHLPSAATRAAAGRWRVRDVMKREVDTIPVESTLAAAWERARKLGGHCFPVLNNDRLVGLVTMDMLEKALAEGEPERRLEEVSLWAEISVHVHADQPLELALERLSQGPGVLPVVNRGDVGRLEGVIDLESILKAFQFTRRF